MTLNVYLFLKRLSSRSMSTTTLRFLDQSDNVAREIVVDLGVEDIHYLTGTVSWNLAFYMSLA